MHDEWSREIECVQLKHCITFYVISVFSETAFLDLRWLENGKGAVFLGCAIIVILNEGNL